MLETFFTTIIAGFVALGTLISAPFSLPFEVPILQDKVTALEQKLDETDEALGAFNVTGGGTYRLKSSVGTTDTSISLSSFKEPVSNINYTTSYMNTTVAYGTIDPQTSRSEFVSFTGITQNSDGSATITGVSRGLTRTPAGSSCTASTTLSQRHPGQSVFILSDSPCLFQEYAVRRNDEAVTGAWTFPEPSASANPATKNYVDNIALGGTTVVDRVTVAGTAGETVTSGQILYFNTLEGEWRKADADVVASTTQVILGVAQGAGTDGVAISGGVLLHGLDTKNTGGVAGNTIYLSNTAGATSTSAGTNSKVLGVIRNSSTFYFDPFMGEVSAAANNTFTGTNTYTASTTFSGLINVNATSTFNAQVEGQIKNTEFLTASTTFTGATTPQPVHLATTTSTAFLADANDNIRMAFIGFAKNSVSDGQTVRVQTSGIVSGFSGLSVGAKYYVQDAVGTIGTSPGTQEILVGVAVSTTEIMIQKGSRYASGTSTFSTTATEVVTVGFRVSSVRVHAAVAASGAVGMSNGGWTQRGGNDVIHATTDAATASAAAIVARAWNAYQDGTGATTGHGGTVTNITDTGFTLDNTKEGSGANVLIFWEAVGEL